LVFVDCCSLLLFQSIPASSSRWINCLSASFNRPVGIFSVAPSARSIRRSFASSSSSSAPTHLPITSLSEDEQALRDSVASFAQKVLAPKVREMDAKGELEPAVLQALFEQGEG
jgi:hypothetical protein